MNRYALAADGRRWWWRPALAGAVATAAVATVVALPVTGQAIPVPTDHTWTPPAYVRTGPDTAGTSGTDHPCFLFHARWNEALDGPQPVCRTYVHSGSAVPQPRTGAIRAGLDTLP
jgi:hypothetical protein